MMRAERMMKHMLLMILHEICFYKFYVKLLLRVESKRLNGERNWIVIETREEVRGGKGVHQGEKFLLI